MQLDLFADSRDTQLRNDVVNALRHYQADVARTALHKLAAEFSADTQLPTLEVLLAALESAATNPCADHAEAGVRRAWLEQSLQPAACRLFGNSEGFAWSQRFWHALANACTALPFTAAAERTAAPALWIEAKQWEEAKLAIQRIPSWQRQPVPLSWMLSIDLATQELDACWAMLAELAWLAPERLSAILQDSAPPALAALNRQFRRAFDGDDEAVDVAWFPAWLLIEHPALAVHLRSARVSDHTPAQVTRLLMELLLLEKQGRHQELVGKRKRLRDLQPWIFGEYMKSR